MNLRVFSDGSIVGGFWQSKKAPPTLPHIFGGWIVFNHLDIPIKWHCWDMGSNKDYSANVAEYGALRSALHWLNENFPMANLEFYLDSQLVCFQMTGKYNCHDKILLTWRDECRRLANMFPSIKYNWHRREEPKAQLADFCSKMTQPKYGGKIPENWNEFIAQMNGVKS